MGKCTSPCQQLHLIKNGLIESGIAKEETIKVLDRAIVPIIKFTHAIVDIKIDISINQDRALKSVHYIKDIIRQFPTLPKIIFVLKQFLVSRDLNEVWHGGLSSYALIAMCISLLQVTYNCILGTLLMSVLVLGTYRSRSQRPRHKSRSFASGVF